MTNYERQGTGYDSGAAGHELQGRETLGTALPKEMARVRDLLPLYDAIPTGGFASAFMRVHLDAAAKAMAEGDLARMIVAYDCLKAYKA